jgi:translation initiation factor 2B subunit (eIF-2B alpha/beta/delta family)
VQNLGAAKFKVIYVREETRVEESDRIVRELRSKGIPVAEIAEASVAYVMGLLRQVDMVIVGAEAVTSNGGIISRMGTLQLSKLATQAGLPFYVAAETHKFARKFVMDQRDIGFKQEILDFSVDNKSKDIVDAVDFTVCDSQTIALDRVANELNSPLTSFLSSSQRMGLSFLAMCLSSFSISMVVSTVERNGQSTGSAASILMLELEWCVFIH